MSKAKSVYVCQSCGSIHAKWAGKCDACNAWDTVVEEVTSGTVTAISPKKIRASKVELAELSGEEPDRPRLSSGVAEVDRILGGGFVEGSAILIGGEPGIGKSTLILQVAANISGSAGITYISGEESIQQIKLRAKRLGVQQAAVLLGVSTSLAEILSIISSPDHPKFIIIDSIQTIYHEAIDSAPGTVAQVRACSHELISACKKRGIVLIIVGHVTKEGQIAGPRVLEHMVDTVLYFEGDRGGQFRIIRSVKNRFGATDEIGIMEMTEKGLVEVGNPSSLFLCERDESVSGTSVFAAMEGTRPLLVEIQALVVPSFLATPRRAVVGFESARLSMILAVLEARCGIKLSQHEVYVSVAGGFRASEPAADLAVAAAIISALSTKPTPKASVFFGEVGLSGEVRKVAKAEHRLREAGRLGFKHAYGADLKETSRLLKAANIPAVRELSHMIELTRELKN